MTPFCPPSIYLSSINLVSDEVYICSSLLLMIFWWLPYLAKGRTPDFNSAAFSLGRLHMGGGGDKGDKALMGGIHEREHRPYRGDPTSIDCIIN